MELTELDEAKMKVMKEIADSNVILSGLQADIKQLEQDKEAFFQLRQDMLESRLAEYLRDSNTMVKATNENYIHVHNFYEELKKFAQIVKEQRDEVKKQIEDFNNKSIDFENYMVRQTAEISRLNTQISTDLRSIDKEKAYITAQKDEIAKEKAILATKQTNLKVALEALNKKK